MSRIYLVGFMGVGKSTAGKKLAALLNYQFLDMDVDFEESFKISINEFFKKYDENLFRKIEYEKLISTFECKNMVVSTGGGTACFFDSMDKMNQNGLTVYLKMPAEAIVSRLKKAKIKRPLLQNINDDELLEFIENKLNERKVFYEKATIIIDAIDLDSKQLADQINERFQTIK